MTSPTTHQPAATDTSSSSVAANPPTADLPKPFSKGEVDYTNMTPHQRKNWEESLKKKPGKSFKIAEMFGNSGSHQIFTSR